MDHASWNFKNIEGHRRVTCSTFIIEISAAIGGIKLPQGKHMWFTDSILKISITMILKTYPSPSITFKPHSSSSYPKGIRQRAF